MLVLVKQKWFGLRILLRKWFEPAVPSDYGGTIQEFLGKRGVFKTRDATDLTKDAT